jgi:hypothetical protein
MNKIIFFILTSSLIFSQSLFAQSTILGLNGGVLFPQDTEAGAIVGASWGKMIDQNVGWEIETDYFWRTFTQEMTVEVKDAQTQTTTIATEIENSTKMLPIFFKLVFLSEVFPNLDLRLSGGLGYSFLWTKDANYKLGTESSETYSGFAWQAGAGLSFPISQAADFYGEAIYLGATPSTDEGTTADGLPQRTEVDMSGLWLRVGLRLYH